jgi:hypothetical protein
MTTRFARIPIGLLLGLGATVASTRAHAQEPKRETGTFALSFVRGAGAEGCPSRQELEREVSTRLGHSPFDSSAEKSIEILTERTPDGYRSVVSAIDRDGTILGRRVVLGEEPSCAPIFSATALAVALFIDPEAALSRDSRANEAVGRFEVDEPARPPPAPVPAPAAAPPPAPVAPPPPPPPAPPARDTAIAVTGVEAVATLGLVPAFSPGVGIYTEGFPGSRLGFSLSALYVSKASVTQGNASLDVSLSTFGAAITFSPVNGRALRLVMDAGLSAGALHVSVREAPAVGLGDHGHYALSFGARVEATVINGFFFSARAGGAVPLVRHELSVEEEIIWTEPPIGGMASLGVGWAFF